MNYYELFAQILDYPTSDLAMVLDQGTPETQPTNPPVAEHLTEFKGACERIGLGGLEELYTKTFDLQAHCSLYAGYHLFGDDWRRSLFLAELKGRYQAAGFSCGSELPDHFPVLLRFLSVQTNPDEEAALRLECLVPAAAKVAARLDPRLNPYRSVLDALLLWLGAPLARSKASSEKALPAEHDSSFGVRTSEKAVA